MCSRLLSMNRRKEPDFLCQPLWFAIPQRPLQNQFLVTSALEIPTPSWVKKFHLGFKWAQQKPRSCLIFNQQSVLPSGNMNQMCKLQRQQEQLLRTFAGFGSQQPSSFLLLGILSLYSNGTLLLKLYWLVIPLYAEDEWGQLKKSGLLNLTVPILVSFPAQYKWGGGGREVLILSRWKQQLTPLSDIVLIQFSQSPSLSLSLQQLFGMSHPCSFDSKKIPVLILLLFCEV